MLSAGSSSSKLIFNPLARIRAIQMPVLATPGRLRMDTTATTPPQQQQQQQQQRLSPAAMQRFKYLHTVIAQERSTSPQVQDEAPAAAALAQEYPSGVCEILLNRPKKLNAFNTEMCEIMIENLLAWEKSDSTKMILVKGSGNRAFCAGGDIKALLDLEEAGHHDEAAHIFYRHCQLQHLIGSLKKPYIALMDGITMGAAVGLSMNAPFRIATEKSVYSMPENIIGHFNDASASFWMPRLDGCVGHYLGLTAQRLHGPDVFYAGIATHYVPSRRINELEAALDDLASQNKDPLDKEDINAVIERFSAEDMEKEEAPPFSLAGGIYQAVNRSFQHKTVEDIVASLENETSAKDWAKETLDQLSGMSPTSLKRSLQLFHSGSRLSLLDCMKLEYQLAHRTLAEREFAEGTRSTLVTRTKPKWDPPTLEQVDADEMRRQYFDAPIDKPLVPLYQGGTYMEYPHTRYMLPKCSEILSVANKFCGDRERTVKHFIDKYNGKHGVKAKVNSLL